MQILTRLNKVIAYSEAGYIPVGNTAICVATNDCYDDALIIDVDCVPTDIDRFEYHYVNGKFVKGPAIEVIPISRGGTDATTVEEARQNLNFIGVNPIPSVEEDTVANWMAFGTGTVLFNSNGLITDQPSQFGTILNFVANDTVTQVWAGSGITGLYYRRGSTSSGWATSWNRLLNETNGIQMKKVWQNASPGSSFGTQTISIDLSEYEYFMIECRGWKNDDNSLFTFGRMGRYTLIDNIRNVTANNMTFAVFQRGFEPSATGMFFTTNSGKTSTSAAAVGTDNEGTIPIRIYGIKGVQ